MIIPQISLLVHKDWDGNFPKFLWFLFCSGILTGINLPVPNYLGSVEPNCAVFIQVKSTSVDSENLKFPENNLKVQLTSGNLDDNKKILKLTTLKTNMSPKKGLFQ